MRMLVLGRLAVDVIPALMHFCYHDGVLANVFHLQLHFIAYSHGVGRSNFIYLENTFDACIVKIPLLVLNSVPAAGRFIDQSFHCAKVNLILNSLNDF